MGGDVAAIREAAIGTAPGNETGCRIGWVSSSCGRVSSIRLLRSTCSAHTLTEHAQTEHMHHYHHPHDFDVFAEAKELELFTSEGILLCDLLIASPQDRIGNSV